MQEDLAETKTTLAKRVLDLEYATSKIHDLERTVQRKGYDMGGATSELQTLQMQYATLKDTISRERVQHTRALDNAQAICKDFGDDNARLQQEVMTLRRELSRAMENSRQSEHTHVQRVQTDFWAERDALVNAHDREIDDLRRQLGSGAPQEDNNSERLRHLEDDIKSAMAHSTRLQQENRDMTDNVRTLTMQLDTSSAKTTTTEAEAAALRTELARVLDQVR